MNRLPLISKQDSITGSYARQQRGRRPWLPSNLSMRQLLGIFGWSEFNAGTACGVDYIRVWVNRLGGKFSCLTNAVSPACSVAFCGFLSFETVVKSLACLGSCPMTLVNLEHEANSIPARTRRTCYLRDLLSAFPISCWRCANIQETRSNGRGP
jgi:hypothetical protein